MFSRRSWIYHKIVIALFNGIFKRGKSDVKMEFIQLTWSASCNWLSFYACGFYSFNQLFFQKHLYVWKFCRQKREFMIVPVITCANMYRGILQLFDAIVFKSFKVLRCVSRFWEMQNTITITIMESQKKSNFKNMDCTYAAWLKIQTPNCFGQSCI